MGKLKLSQISYPLVHRENGELVAVEDFIDVGNVL